MPYKNSEDRRKWQHAYYHGNHGFRERKIKKAISRKQNDLQVRLAANLRHRMYMALRNNQRAGSAVEDLGCSIQAFKLYIEHQFEEGMTWNNYGEAWELDHVLQIHQFDLTNRSEYLEACNWLNIRPMYVIENRSRPKW